MFRRFRRTAGATEEEVLAFALSGGGSRGASQVGALRALHEAGIWPDIIAGTSAGAINATWIAMFPRQLDELEAVWLNLRKRDVFPGTAIQVLVNLTRNGHLYSSARWESFLHRYVGSAHFEDLAMPCSVVAVRLSDGERVVFDSGPILPALMATTAIPGIFPPRRIGDELYVDGGVLEPLPVPTLLDRGATTIYALDCSGFERSFRGGSIIDRCSRIGSTAAAHAVTSLAVTRGRKVHLLRPELPGDDDARDFRRTRELIDRGYEYTRRYLQQLAAEEEARDRARLTPRVQTRTVS